MVDASEGHERGVWERVDERIRRAHLVAVAEDHKHRARHPTQLIAGHRGRRTSQARRERLRVVPWCLGEPGEGLGERVLRRRPFDGLGHRVDRFLAEEVRTNAADDEPAEAIRAVGGEGQKHAGAQGEADGVDLAFREHLGDPFLEFRIRTGVMRFRCGAMSEEVDRDHLPSRIRKEIHPARLPPVPLERRREAVDEKDTLRAHSPHRISLIPMSRRIDIELTSARDDGTWTWRAAGAKQPKGVLDGALVSTGAKVGDVFRAEAEFEIEGITITSLLPPKEKRDESTNRLEIIGPRTSPGVTTSLQPKREGRPPRGGGPGEDRGDRGDRGDRDRRPKPDRGDRRERPPRDRDRERSRPPRTETPAAPPKPKPRKLNPASTHRNAVLESLPPEHRPIAEQVLRGGLPAIRQAVDAQNAEAKAEGKPEVNAGPLIAIAEDLLPRLKSAEWLDRAEAASQHVDEISIRDLRSVVASAGTGGRDEAARQLSATLKEALDRRLAAERDQWLKEITTALDEGRLVRALRISSRPPEPSARMPADLAAKLSEAAGAAMTADVAPERWATMLDAVGSSPVRRSVKPAALPSEPGPDLLNAARAAAGRVPALAAMLGIDMPPPPGPPRSGRGPRRPRPPKPPPPPPQPAPEAAPAPAPEAVSETH